LARVNWVRPELVIRAELGGWTREGIVRQGAFKGVEVGKEARDVTRERAVESRAAARAIDDELPDSVTTTNAATTAEATAAVPTPGKAKPATRKAAHSRVGDEAGAGHLHPWSASPSELAALAAMPREGTW